MRLSAFLESVLPRPRAVRRQRPSQNLRKAVRPLLLERLEDRLSPSRTITAITLDGGSSVTVNPVASISVVMDVTTAGNGNSANWRSSGWFIGTTPPSAYNIVDTPDQLGPGNYSATFTITTPIVSGTYNAYFAAFQNNNGAGGPGTFVLNNSVIVVNSAPTANAGGPYTISEGGSLTLDASASSDPDGDSLTYSWDVNGDGTFGDATGVNPTLTWSQLQAL